MLHLPPEIILLLQPFVPLFSRRVWVYAQVLLIGAILAPGKRTVTAVLRIMGLSHAAHFQNYHRVLNRACWSSRAASRLVLYLLIRTFLTDHDPIVVGIDETIERRRGDRIAAKGIYRDPVRSSHDHFVKASGLRWISLMLLTPIPWVKRVWALPFLTVLAPSERYHQERGLRHKTITDWGRQMLRQLRRWLPGRTIVVVADSTYAVIELLLCCARLAQPVTLITRLRMDAALYDPAPMRPPLTNGRPRVKGARQPTLAQRVDAPCTSWLRLEVQWYGRRTRTIEVATGTAVWYHPGMPPAPLRWVLIRDPQGQFRPQALLCTALALRPEQIVGWFVLRWQLEVTFHEVRAHLGVETQRQWSDRAILRTTPALLAVFSLVTLFAQRLQREQPLMVRQVAWYQKEVPTFSDTLAFVRQHLWLVQGFALSASSTDAGKPLASMLERLTDALAYIA